MEFTITLERGPKHIPVFQACILKLEFSRELVVLLIKILLLFFLLQVEETIDNNRNSHAPSVPVQGLNSGPLTQESVDGWMTNAQSTQSGQNLVSSVHEPDSSSEDRQSEVLATNFTSSEIYISCSLHNILYGKTRYATNVYN